LTQSFERISPRRSALILALFVLVGANMRTIILAVPPVLPQIARDLELSHTATGLLTALPVLFMGLGAGPAGLLMPRLGGRLAVGIGMALVGAAAMLRALSATVWPLYALTVILSLGIALSQTSIVALVRLWFPGRIGFASAMYTNGVIAGEALGAGLTLPLLAILGPDAWRPAIAAWGIPVFVVLVLWMATTPPGIPPRARGAHAKAAGDGSLAVRTPFLLLGIHLGLLSGSCSVIYFTMNAWTAPYNAAVGQTGVTALSLLLLNASQLPVCLCLTPFAQRLTGRRLPFALSGLFCLVAMAGWMTTPPGLQPLWSAVFGASSVTVLVLGLALPPYFARPASVARLVGLTLTVSYLLSFSAQVIGGRLWDVTGHPLAAFAAVPVAAVAMIVLAVLLPRPLMPVASMNSGALASDHAA
jgi:CP family cyanate transporter-like MFS transporter